MAIDMLDVAKRISKEHGIGIVLRIGIASGPVLAGVIGAKRLIYDVWGDTVNLASRLEGHSHPQGILISELTRVRLGDRYRLEPHESIEIKGYGFVQPWLLKGVQPADGAATLSTAELSPEQQSMTTASPVARSAI
jgi:class 3 adenylate cyclase